jgi:galactokinase
VIELSYPGDLTDTDELALQLSRTGLGPEASESKARLFAKAVAALSVTGQAGHAPPSLAFFVPGRIEVLGKHTDYAGGRALVAAAERGFCMVAQPRDDRRMIVIDARSGETIRFQVDPELQPQAGSWSNYPMTVARRVARDFPGACRGAAVAFCSDLPPAAGMSSSSALLAGIFLILAEVNQLPARDAYWHNIGNKIDLAGYLSMIESGQSFGTLPGDQIAETFSGNEDQTAIICAEPGHLSQFAFAPVEFERLLPLPAGHLFAIGTSGLMAETTESAKEKCRAPRRLASALVDLWRRETGRDDPHLATALGSTADAADRLRDLLDTADVGALDRDVLTNRLEQFELESETILAVGDALLGGELRVFGRLVERSQYAAERLLGNQTPETVFLAASARRMGAVAASSFGDGFGGSVWAMVETSRADDFLTAWADEYRDQFSQHAATSHFFLTGAGPAALRVC